VNVTMILVVTVGLHLYLRETTRGKEMEIYPLSCWGWRIRELELPLGWSLRTRLL
jgi:hypothetical protein